MKRYYLFIVKSLIWSSKFYFFIFQSFNPVVYRVLRNKKRYRSYLACSSMSFGYVWPMEKSKNRPWTSYLITIIKMVGSRVILVYCKLYKPESQVSGIEVNVSLRITSYSCNMVYTQNISLIMIFLFCVNFSDVL